MTKKQKKMLTRIIAAAVGLIAVALLDHFGPALPLPVWPLYLIPYFVIGWDILWKAIRNIAHGQVFDENFLMAIATVGALCIGEFPEAVFVMLFYQVGELFQGVAVGKSRKSIAALMDIRPDSANVEREGEIVDVDPDEVHIGETIVIRPGERVPIDGVVLEGASALNTAALTGESLPRDVEPGDDVISGCINLTGLLRVRTTKEFGESTVAKIWTWWRIPAPKRAAGSNLSPGLPGGTLRRWSLGRWLWQLFLLWSPGSGPSGWSRPLFS